MPVKQNEQAAGNGGGDAVSAEYPNIPLSGIVIDAQIRSEIDMEDESFQSLKAAPDTRIRPALPFKQISCPN